MQKFFIKEKKGFTLIEILVVMAIIGVLFIGATNINFSRMSDRQKSLMFANDVYVSIENSRNDALFGKGVGTSLINPSKSIVNISTANSGSIRIDYYSGSTILRSDSGATIIPFSSINSIICSTIDYSLTGSITNIGIIFEGNSLSLSGCNVLGNSGSIVDIKTKYKDFEETIRINGVSGVMERL